MRFKKTSRSVLLVALLCSASAFAESESETDSMLDGKWKAVDTRVYRADGSTSRQPGLDCSLEIARARMVSECSSKQGMQKKQVISKYRLIKAGRYEATTVEIKNGDSKPGTSANNVGARNVADYRIEEDKLFITRQLPDKSRLETVYLRQQ